MTVLIVPQDTARGFKLEGIPLADGQSVTFAVGAVSTGYTVNGGSVTVLVPANAAIEANNGATWTLKQGETTYRTGTLYVTLTDSSGETGPAGPPGEDGADGADGAPGAGLGLLYTSAGKFMYFPQNSSATATGVITAGNVYYVPVFIEKTGGIAIDQVVYEVTVLAASSVTKVGLYSAHATTGMPETLIGQASNTGDGTTVAQKTISWSTTLPKGLSWLCIVAQGGTPTVRTITGRSPFVHSFSASNAANTTGYLTNASLTSGDFPTNAIAPTAHGSVPNLGVRYA